MEGMAVSNWHAQIDSLRIINSVKDMQADEQVVQAYIDATAEKIRSHESDYVAPSVE